MIINKQKDRMESENNMNKRVGIPIINIKKLQTPRIAYGLNEHLNNRIKHPI